MHVVSSWLLRSLPLSFPVKSIPSFLVCYNVLAKMSGFLTVRWKESIWNLIIPWNFQIQRLVQAMRTCHTNPCFKTFETTNAFAQHRKPQWFKVLFDSPVYPHKGRFGRTFGGLHQFFPRADGNPLISKYNSLWKILVCRHLFFLPLWRAVLNSARSWCSNSHVRDPLR